MNTYTLTEATRQRLMEIADMNADHESFALLKAAPSTSLTEAQVTAAIDKWFSKEFEYNSSMETRMRAAISAALAIKGGA